MMKNDALIIFNEIYDDYYKKIINFFKKDFTNEDAEDLTQQVFMQLWAWIPNNYAIKNKKALIYSIAKNVRNDRIRKNKIILETMIVPEDFDAPDKNDFQSMLDIRLSIEKLKPKEQQLLLLKLYGYNSSEIGDMLDCTASAVRTKLQKIRKKLK